MHNQKQSFNLVITSSTGLEVGMVALLSKKCFSHSESHKQISKAMKKRNLTEAWQGRRNLEQQLHGLGLGEKFNLRWLTLASLFWVHDIYSMPFASDHRHDLGGLVSDNYMNHKYIPCEKQFPHLSSRQNRHRWAAEDTKANNTLFFMSIRQLWGQNVNPSQL